ncbi:hypothetical protein BU14_0135s0040 [Porphyra umbilicalis]|uniref:Uncharacterized protein n=1 Tax=Porphyra umbilicalis TaxID=2786 RepID=A0A1X6PAL5_PORUM|nr:hypothetical protein BU14_0135s0040 [Porphyra umbilicalis]|eukprot:OSX77766.1 hypothetical protein BU14_0135s0040 [Porphyra umbilicalis]
MLQPWNGCNAERCTACACTSTSRCRDVAFPPGHSPKYTPRALPPPSAPVRTSHPQPPLSINAPPRPLASMPPALRRTCGGAPSVRARQHTTAAEHDQVCRLHCRRRRRAGGGCRRRRRAARRRGRRAWGRRGGDLANGGHAGRRACAPFGGRSGVFGRHAGGGGRVRGGRGGADGRRRGRGGGRLALAHRRHVQRRRSTTTESGKGRGMTGQRGKAATSGGRVAVTGARSRRRPPRRAGGDPSSAARRGTQGGRRHPPGRPHGGPPARATRRAESEARPE